MASSQDEEKLNHAWSFFYVYIRYSTYEITKYDMTLYCFKIMYLNTSCFFLFLLRKNVIRRKPGTRQRWLKDLQVWPLPVGVLPADLRLWPTGSEGPVRARTGAGDMCRCFGRWFLMKTTKKSVFLGFSHGFRERFVSTLYQSWFVWSGHKRSVYSGIDFSCHRTRCVNWPVIVVV